MYPLVYIVIAYIAGILLACNVSLPFTVIYIFIIFLVISYFFLRSVKIKSFVILLVILGIGSVSCNIHTRIFPPNHIKNFAIDGHQEAELIGTIIKDMEIDEENGRSYLLLEAEKLNYIDISGLVQAAVWSDLELGDYEYGERIKVHGTIFKPYSYNTKFNYEKYLNRKNIFALMSVKPWKNEWIEKTGIAEKNPIVRLIYKIKHRLVKAMYLSMPEERFTENDINVLMGIDRNKKRSLWEQSYLQASLLEGIMLGNDKALPYEYREMFRNTGTIHILAVSGFNVSFVVFLLFLFLRFLHFSGKQSASISVLFIIMFAIMTGGSPSVIRASLMAAIVLFALIIERDNSMFNSIACSAIIVLIFSPSALFDVGFQLSYAATLGLLLFVPVFEKLLKSFPKWLSGSIGVCVGAQIAIIPIIAYYFNKVSIVSFIANLVIVPVVGIITALGFLTGFCSVFSLTIAKIFAAFNWLLLTFLLKAVTVFDSIPFASIEVPSPSFLFFIFYYMAIAIFLKIIYIYKYDNKII